jgi:hypothetical protein
MYASFNQEQWAKCFSLVDPRLRQNGRVIHDGYVATLRQFKAAYGEVKPWHIRINLHLKEPANKRDRRPFAYVYVVWQDKLNAFHMFRERWVKHGGRWFTRVAGLVPNRSPADSQIEQV